MYYQPSADSCGKDRSTRKKREGGWSAVSWCLWTNRAPGWAGGCIHREQAGEGPRLDEYKISINRQQQIVGNNSSSNGDDESRCEDSYVCIGSSSLGRLATGNGVASFKSAARTWSRQSTN